MGRRAAPSGPRAPRPGQGGTPHGPRRAPPPRRRARSWERPAGRRPGRRRGGSRPTCGLR
ncbi:MAG: hypothetical protein EGQ66_05400 [Coriobacteriaceae bacterium]|nr:hypothetical protein [Coriobacteriaceae bacterium]